MNNSITKIPSAVNEPIKQYLPGSMERGKLMRELDRQLGLSMDIPLIINGEEIQTSNPGFVVCPHDHQKTLATFSKADKSHVKMAIAAAMNAKSQWESMPWQDRVAIFLKTADLISGKYTYLLNAATMLGQGKNVYQAEIDATCELADFLRFNASCLEAIYKMQPNSEKGVWNRIEYRPLEGFIFALTPFNFTAIAGNLGAAPAVMGNTVVWKPASTSVLSSYYLMKIFQEAGLPDGVINFIPGKGSLIGDIVLKDKDLGGIHFTGSTRVFQTLWNKVGEQIQSYKSYPRIVGETGGKDYIFVHPSANMDQVVTAAIRGAFEYQGQKCSAASRMYIPQSRWNEFQEKMLPLVKELKAGSVMDFKNLVNAVIDEKAFDNAVGYIKRADESIKAKIFAGGSFDKSIGFYIDPTIIVTTDPYYESMSQEIFGPILTIYVYQDDELEHTLDRVDKTSIYALTGAVFANDRYAINDIMTRLSHSAGNFYINDKPTGALVGHQPFGGARGSGTNDKAGSFLNLLRWTSARTIKENFNPPDDFTYPFMED